MLSSTLNMLFQVGIVIEINLWRLDAPQTVQILRVDQQHHVLVFQS